ncbi:MAG: hypothetical protein A2Y23_07515 [Clostridiales bacterium GWB2_37_7]|nr:MAG: hypothetical protein A2Y23_07515 [Clostridiales bacterium GWB2_37_7]
MDNNISLQIKRLIEVDKRAVELESKRENELKQLDQANKLELDSIESQLKSTKEEAKKTYQDLVSLAQKEAEAMNEDTNHKLLEMENTIDQEINIIALEWWNKILKSLK